MLEEIINTMEDKIKISIEHSNLDNIFNNLSNISEPTIICGIGGSNVISIFLSKVLEIKNNIITKNIDTEEYFLANYEKYKNLIMISHRGKNHGIKCLSNTNKTKYLLTTRKSKINNEILLNYYQENRIKSFISLEDTLLPISIILCYYLNTYEFPLHIKSMKDNFNISDFNNVNIIYDYNSKTCATFLETSFVESGISSVTMHTKYSLCHGRSNIISNKESLVIYLMTKNSELDQTLIEQINKISSNFLLLKELNDDTIISDYKLIIKSLYLLDYLNKTYKKEFVNVKYNKIVPTLYHFKGELV